jgi:hypothetical protein
MTLPKVRRPSAVLAALLFVLLAASPRASPLGQAAISSPVTTVSSGQSVTLTASWSGGTQPYALSWYSGTAQNCAQDTGLVQSVSGLSSASSTLAVTPPPGGAYYCITVTDSGTPQASASSASFGVTVNQAAAPTITVAASGVAGSGSLPLCGIVDAVRSIVGILALALFMLGGVLYATSHFLPTNMEFKKSLSAWATAMIIGGVIGLVIVLAAQPLVTMIIGVGNAAGGSVSSALC